MVPPESGSLFEQFPQNSKSVVVVGGGYRNRVVGALCLTKYHRPPTASVQSTVSAV